MTFFRKNQTLKRGSNIPSEKSLAPSTFLKQRGDLPTALKSGLNSQEFDFRAWFVTVQRTLLQRSHDDWINRLKIPYEIQHYLSSFIAQRAFNSKQRQNPLKMDNQSRFLCLYLDRMVTGDLITGVLITAPSSLAFSSPGVLITRRTHHPAFSSPFN